MTFSSMLFGSRMTFANGAIQSGHKRQQRRSNRCGTSKQILHVRNGLPEKSHLGHIRRGNDSVDGLLASGVPYG